MSRPELILLTKQPLPGLVKTRFIPHASAQTAADIALAMIEDTVKKACKYWRGSIRLSVYPNPNFPSLITLANRFNIRLDKQATDDLERNMAFEIHKSLQHAPAAAVMGCDIPTATGKILRSASELLKENKNILGPSIDGGYYIAGFNQKFGDWTAGEWYSNVFQNSPPETREPDSRQLSSVQILFQKLKFDAILPCLRDIDTWNDFEYLVKISPKYAKYKTENC